MCIGSLSKGHSATIVSQQFIGQHARCAKLNIGKPLVGPLKLSHDSREVSNLVTLASSHSAGLRPSVGVDNGRVASQFRGGNAVCSGGGEGEWVEGKGGEGG